MTPREAVEALAAGAEDAAVSAPLGTRGRVRDEIRREAARLGLRVRVVGGADLSKPLDDPGRNALVVLANGRAD